MAAFRGSLTRPPLNACGSHIPRLSRSLTPTCLSWSKSAHQAPCAPLSAKTRVHYRRTTNELPRSVQANWKQEIVWTDVPVVKSEKAAELLFSVTLDIGKVPELQAGYQIPGQFVQVKLGDGKPAFLAIASPPKLAASDGVFEFLVKAVPGSTAEQFSQLPAGSSVSVSQVMGRGFNLAALAPPEACPSVLLFATGSGISPIRAVIEHGFDAAQRSDVRLFFGVSNTAFMPYQDRFAEWEASGVSVLPVFSNPPEAWDGATGFVQAAYQKGPAVADGSKAGAVLCGHKGMAEDVTAILAEQGVPKERILLNF